MGLYSYVTLCRARFSNRQAVDKVSFFSVMRNKQTFYRLIVSRLQGSYKHKLYEDRLISCKTQDVSNITISYPDGFSFPLISSAHGFKETGQPVLTELSKGDAKADDEQLSQLTLLAFPLDYNLIESLLQIFRSKEFHTYSHSNTRVEQLSWRSINEVHRWCSWGRNQITHYAM